MFIRIIYILTLLPLLLTPIFSAGIDVNAKLIPRIILQSSLNKENQTINISIAYRPKSIYRAVRLKKLIANQIKGRVIKTSLLDVSKENYSLDNIQALYLSDLDKRDLENIINKAQKEGVITFSKNIEQFKKGAIFFIESKRKINIYLNTKFSNDANIGFHPSLLKYVKNYDEK